MKIAYVYHWNEGPSSGVQQKVRRQAEAWAEAGHDTRRLIVCRQEVAGIVGGGEQQVFGYGPGLDRLLVWGRVARSVLAWGPDVVYHRYDLFAPGLWRLARRTPLILEINTNDITEYALQSRARALFNRLTRGLLLGQAAAHVYVTHELAHSPHFARFRRPGVVIANGVNLIATSPLEPVPMSEALSLVFLGTPGQPWQGVDKIMALARAWPEAHFDVVGSGTQDLPEGVPENLVLHGYLSREAYQLLLRRATVALGSLALHRKAMHEASPLKVREYLAAGLPVVVAYQDTDFPEGAPFLLDLPNEEDNLVPHLARLQAFALAWKGRRVERAAIQAVDSAEKEQKRLAFMAAATQGRALVSSGRSVLLLTTALTYGGAEAQVTALALGLRARGWQVTVVSMVPPVAFTHELKQAGVAVETLDMKPSHPSWRALWRWRAIMRRVRPNIVHSHMIHANLLGRVGRIVTRVPVLINTAHSIDEGGGWRKWAYTLTDRLTTITTNVSDAATARYIRDRLVPAGRIRTLPNGVDTTRFVTEAGARATMRAELGLADTFVWLSVGRFVPAKDHATLLRAFGPLAQADKRVTLLLVGEGELQDETRHLAWTYGVEGQVHFLGRRDDIAALMGAADAYVMSSAWEGLPMVLLEAGVSGLPVVATDVGGNAETLAPGAANRLVRAGDAKDLRAAMQAVMALPEADRRDSGFANARLVQEHFDLEGVLDRWEALYHEMAGGR